MRNDNRPWLAYGLLLCCVLSFAVLRYFFFAQTGDDSYIYFRYVERALAGQWWSWSNHIPPVEGYSSPLWYFLLIASGKAGLPVILAARLWGAFFAFMTLGGTWVLARQLKASTLLSAIACLLLVFNHGFNYWASAGLETSLYAALLVWSCVGIIRERQWFLPTALLGLARPEGVFLLFALLCCIFLFKRRQFSLTSLLLCFMPTLLWLLLRLSIYGEWLPNTFYAKAAGDPADQFFKGLVYCLPVLLPLLVGWLLWWSDRSLPLMVTLGMVSMLAGIVWLGGGDWMFHFRLLVPMYALLLAALASQWQAISSRARALLVAALLPYLLLLVPPHYVFLLIQGGQLPLSDYQEGNMTHVSFELAEHIRKEFPAPALIAVNHAGALPWALPEYDVIDMVGLNDAHIARAPGKLHHKYDIDYVLGLQPDLLVLNSRTRPGSDGVWYHKGYWSGENALVEHPGFADYRPTGIVLKWHWRVPYPYSLVVKNADTSWIMVYRRKP